MNTFKKVNLTFAALIVIGVLPASAGYQANPTSIQVGSDSATNTTYTPLRLTASASQSSYYVTFTVTKYENLGFSTGGTLKLLIGCGTTSTSCQLVSTKPVAAGDTSIAFSSVYMPSYVTGTTPKSFYVRYEATNGYWTWVGPIEISAPSLATPTGLSTTQVGLNSAGISWSTVTGANRYHYQVATSSFSTGSDTCNNCFKDSTTSSTSATITGLTPGRLYYWRVRAGNDISGQGSLWPNHRTFTTAQGSFIAPTPSSAEGLFDIGVSVSAPNGIGKVSVAITAGNNLVLCEDASSTPCSGTSGTWQATGVNPRDYGVTGSSTLTLGLWVRDDTGVSEVFSTKNVSWTSDATGSILQPSTSTVRGLMNLALSAADPNGVAKVSLVFGAGAGTYVLCGDSQTPTCSNPYSSGTRTIWPADYGALANQTNTLGLWVRDNLGNTELVDSHSFYWEKNSNGYFSQPSGSSIEGMVAFGAGGLSDPQGISKVSIVFTSGGQPLVLCDDSQSLPCSQSSYTSAPVFPSDYGASPGVLNLGLWMKDDAGNTEIVATKSLTWTLDATGNITSPGAEVDGLITVTATANGGSGDNGLAKVSVIFVANGAALVLCENGNASLPACSGSSWSRAQVDPHSYGVVGNGPIDLTLGLWTLDGAGHIERPDTHSLRWSTSNASGSITSPGTSAEGPLQISASASDPNGLDRVRITFNGGASIDLCNDAGSVACVGTSAALAASNVDPAQYGVSAGSITLGLWIEDDRGGSHLAATQTLQWQPRPVYPDVSAWAQDAANYLVQNGIVDDNPQHLLRGQDSANRAELATMIYRALGGGKAAADENFLAWAGIPRSSFSDIQDPSVWYYSPAAYLGRLTFSDSVSVFDRKPGVFRPALPIDRSWSTKALLEAWNIELLNYSSSMFSDVPSTHPALLYIENARESGLLNGTTFRPDDEVRREELFVMLHRLLDDSANLQGSAPPHPAPISRSSFVDSRNARVLGTRFEQPVLGGTTTPEVELLEGTPQIENIGALKGIYTVDLEAQVAALDQRTFIDQFGAEHKAYPSCYWAASGGSFVELSTPGEPKHCHVKWVAPIDSAIAPVSGSPINSVPGTYNIELVFGDNLGSEIRFRRTFQFGSIHPETTKPLITMASPPVGVLGGQGIVLVGTASDPMGGERADQGLLSIALSYSTNDVDFIPIGRAKMESNGSWQHYWETPANLAGTVYILATVTNVRGHRAEVKISKTFSPNLLVSGWVSGSSGEIMTGSTVTLSKGGQSWSTKADTKGVFSFGSLLGIPLTQGTGYLLEATNQARRTTYGPFTLSSGSLQRNLRLPLDTAPPFASATPAGGTFRDLQIVTLNCSDNNACSQIHYTVDGSPPSLSSPTYSESLSLGSTVLKFFAVDVDGNQGEIETEIYNLDPCQFTLATSASEFGFIGGAGELTVGTATDCSWMISSTMPWVEFPSTSVSGSGIGSVLFQLGLNASPTGRSATFDLTNGGTVRAQILLIQAGDGTQPGCRPPSSGDWTLAQSCTYTGTAVAPASVIVEPGVVLTIEPGAILEIDLKTYKLLVRQGGGVLVREGGTVRQTSGTLIP